MNMVAMKKMVFVCRTNEERGLQEGHKVDDGRDLEGPAEQALNKAVQFQEELAIQEEVKARRR